MARVVYPEGGPEPFEIPDHRVDLAGYYTGEGATVTHSNGRVFADGAYPAPEDDDEQPVPPPAPVSLPEPDSVDDDEHGE